ncbi:MAG TPA: Dyp-type peroxidase [Polyangiaceae bacterium]|nr:Dyp-type peroxidase [Polyangiaceae bacterium]
MQNAPKSTPTRQFAGLVWAPVVEGQLDTLRALLEQITRETQDGMRGRWAASPLIPFSKLQTVHYARFVLIEREPGLGPELIFSTNYDGPEGEESCVESRALALHIDELVREAGPGLERVFSCCRGYREGRLATYLRRHQRKAATFYVGSSGRSRNQILWEAELRRRVDAILDARDFAKTTPEQVRADVAEALGQERVVVPPFPPQPDLSSKLRRFQLGAGLAAVLVLLGSGWWLGPLGPIGILLVLGLAVLRFRQLELRDPQFQPEHSRATLRQYETASATENEFLQNQLTHYVRVKPGLIRALTIRLVFFVLQRVARYTYNKGKLGDIPSIHFARWVLLPQRGVLFLSNFDSSWQSYLGDFIDQASSGLTAVWSNTEDYPHATWLLRAGSRDAARFLAWTRHNQRPTQVWYSAYPGLSIVNVNANTEIRRGLATPACMDAATWLFRLRNVDRLGADQQYSEEQVKEPPLPLADIQGIVLWGYGHMPCARFLMLRVERSASEARAWLSALPLSSAAAETKTAQPPEPLVNVAFTHRGLQALGVDAGLCERFSIPFVQGSEHPDRARVNGDLGLDAPEHWEWGGPLNPVHLVLMVYASTDPSAEEFADQFQHAAEQAGLTCVARLEGATLPDRKEHFGFRDGIAQPVVQGSGRAEPLGNTVAAGEFLLGHKDGYGNISYSPVSSAGFAFGMHGSYLVFRQLEQDVVGFWRYCAERAPDRPVRLASKMVGRWPSGATLVRHPDGDPKDVRFRDEDDFTYLGTDEDNDRYGARCPFGAHIRRTNPRDWQLGTTRAGSLELSNLHRILRRSRPYGPCLESTMDAEALVASALQPDADAPRVNRGLQFLCFNSNIERQFEFIQQQWSNNPKFAGQNSDVDPLIGARGEPGRLGIDNPAFTLQSNVKAGIGPRALQLRNFVRLRGSAYFFMPSIPAVRMLAEDASKASTAERFERIPRDEQLHIENLIETLREKLNRDYITGETLRDAHPKMHGLVRATLRVERELEPRLRVGLFAHPAEYPAWIRFSNASEHVQDDAARDIRGAALKLMGVPGSKLLEGAEDLTTHDFLLVTHDTFVTRDVAGFDELMKAVAAGTLPRLGLLARRPSVAWRVWQSFRHHQNLLDTTFFSAVPYLFGDTAVKYSLRPRKLAGVERAQLPRSATHLRDALKADLSRGPAVFEFLVQFYVSEARTPIEDPTVRWDERITPFHHVATLEIAAQEFDTEPRRAFGENLVFNPWRCLPEHRPLGGIQRARRQVYRALSAFRRARNAAVSKEPTVESNP